MNTKFTKGPWSLSTVTTSSGVCHKIGPFPPRRGDGALRHACLYSDYNSTTNPADVELLANAALIASAPELYAALEQIAALYIDDRSSAMHKALCIANKALKKARGEA